MSERILDRLAVDIGGTFTDVALDHGGQLVTTKTLTTPARPIEGVLNGIRAVIEMAEIAPNQIGTIIHGTTLASNALIERKGAKTGFITTEGFRDILEIAYERRYDQYDLMIDKPEMLVRRDHCWTVNERIDADGKVITALDEESVRAVAEQILENGIESIAVCLLHSYLTASHERRVREILQEVCPDISVTISADVCPEIREYDRACTTIGNAYIKPLMASYLEDLSGAITAEGIESSLFIMTSGGGMTTLDTAIRAPIRLVESGPSGGAILACQVAEQCGADKVVAFDMGGTTAKLCLLENYKPHRSRQFEIARAARFIKGSGLPVRIPVIEMIEIGAGGGSIARIDSLGRIAVGPDSASSDPGPVCYGKGGGKPTVTDSDLILGYLDPDNFAEGKFRLDRDSAEAVVAEQIGAPLGFDATVAAYGISQLVDESMANAARVHAAEWGQEVAGGTLIATGGNGPLHASRIADKTDIDRIIIPCAPGVGSAIGFLSAPVSYEIIRSLYCRLSSFDASLVSRLIAEMETEARDIVRAGNNDDALNEKRVAFMRYDGQGHELEVIVPEGPITAETGEILRQNFEEMYLDMFGRLVPGVDIEIINWAFVAATMTTPPAKALIPANTNPAKPSGKTRIYSRKDEQMIEVETFNRADLSTGDRVEGPALIAESQTTTLVARSFQAVIDSAGNIVMNRIG
ncbi:hydantoinase/oxoprolinase family protein [Ruegeria sp. Ofav3-42]|uniref:hydantoinase/oxoprolinase family protein n=1 Tax=Ruegeria sp. Ofav3-42 TaxID=2917759 RepID=UPI001EF452DE|nr:hydantoinase/oxoprolinase family protein [Ruegeria sp. Ofav3-42]